MNNRKPNLFLVGAMKCGSTTLHELLAAHPDICMSEPKEPCRFIEPELLKRMWPEMWRLGYWRDEAAYLSLFAGKPSARYRGESSTDYSKLPLFSGVVERIAAYSPEARIVYVMRDPVERTVSHYWHMVEHRGETRPPLQAITADPHYTDVSHYAMQLRPYVERFGREHVHVLTFEELTRSPQQTVQSVYAWLGVDSAFVPKDLSSARNATPSQVRQKRAGASLLNRFRHSPLWARAGHLAPAWLRRVGVSLVEKRVQRRDVDMSVVMDYLRKRQQAETAELEKLVGRTFPEWETLHGR